jgi:hypothetical protein
VDAALVPLLAALLGGVLALAGQALTPFVNSKHQHQQWVRDKRVQSCETLFRLIREAQADESIDEATRIMMHAILDRQYQPSQHSLQLTRDFPQLLNLSHRLAEAANLVQLYASEELRVAARETAFRLATVVATLTLPRQQVPEGSQERAVASFFQQAKETEQLIRQELAIP